MLTPELLARLREPNGEALLARARELADDAFAAEKLRRHLPDGQPPELAAAAVEQVRLRLRAAGRFRRAAEMWFAPGLLEQASGDVVAHHRAARFARWERAGDLCCGLGGDVLALAERVEVAAVDRDPLALALTRANVDSLGLSGRVTVCPGELPADAPDVPAAWVDPGRREGGKRTRRLDAMSPTLREVLELRDQIPHLGVKLSPATDDHELDEALAGIPHERELLSVGGECRELALWLGDLRTESAGGELRRATLFVAGRLAGELMGTPGPWGAVRAPGSWLLEPDAAVIRAGLVGNLAERLKAWPVDPKLAYLSTDALPETPFARAYRVGPPEPFSLKALGERLRRMEAGDVVLKTRGSAAPPEVLRQQLRRVLKQGRPDCRPVAFITRLDGRAVMLLGESFGPGAEC